MRRLGRGPVFFAHIPRTGGTTLNDWVASHLDANERYPSAASGAFYAEKMYPAPLRELDPDRCAPIRYYSPHLPLSAHELLPVEEVSTVTMVRNPVDQLRSSLDTQVPGEDDEDALLVRLEQLPSRWYATNQLGWYLGADRDEVLAVFDRVSGVPAAGFGTAFDAALSEVIGGRSLVAAACERLDSMTMVVPSDDRQPLLDALADWLGVEPLSPQRRLNRSAGTELSGDVRSLFDDLTTDDRAIYEHALCVAVSPRARP